MLLASSQLETPPEGSAGSPKLVTVDRPPAATLDELWDAVARVGTPAVIKTAAFGYDGKGQHKVATPADVEMDLEVVDG